MENGEEIWRLLLSAIKCYEAMHIVRKGQIEGVGKGNVEGRVRFVESLSKVAA